MLPPRIEKQLQELPKDEILTFKNKNKNERVVIGTVSEILEGKAKWPIFIRSVNYIRK